MVGVGSPYVGKGAVLATATILATPYLFAYDLPVLILPTCWMALKRIRAGFRPWERLSLGVFSGLLLSAERRPSHFTSIRQHRF